MSFIMFILFMGHIIFGGLGPTYKSLEDMYEVCIFNEQIICWKLVVVPGNQGEWLEARRPFTVLSFRAGVKVCHRATTKCIVIKYMFIRKICQFTTWDTILCNSRCYRKGQDNKLKIEPVTHCHFK